jgi:dinuclear metal center YbgI/SA1388 family protein
MLGDARLDSAGASAHALPPMSETLANLVAILERIAPLELAQEWDNVGLLLAPSRARRVARVLLTIDLTEAVAEEALAQRAELIVAYHPPIFAPLKRLIGGPLVRLIEHRIAVYSPHTALDAAHGGVNDWLASGLGAGKCRPIEPATSADVESPTPVGQGRTLQLERPVTLGALAARVKRHLGLSRVRVAAAASHRRGGPIRRIALCAGAGGSVVTKATAADVYLTGEMRHHDILAANASRISVILTDHSNSERGYLSALREKLAKNAGRSISVMIARSDVEPLASR